MLIKGIVLTSLTRRFLIMGMAFPILAYGEWRSTQFDSMGTRFELEIWAPSAQSATQTYNNVRVELERIENLLSPYIESSDVSRINKNAGLARVEVSEITYQLVQRAEHFSRLSDGAFDISFASVGRKYDFPKAVKPAADEVVELRELIDYRLIKHEQKMDDEKARYLIGLEMKGMAIDLGGIAKGFAVDRVADILIGQGIEAAAISLGGDSRFLGDRGSESVSDDKVDLDPPGRMPWVVAIKHPRGGEENRPYALRMPLADTSFSTSGDYERYFIDDEGERVHHIIDVDSGKSAANVVSVSIIGERSMDCDALSTTVFVLGVEKGLSLIEKVEGYDAIIIDSQGKMHYSSGLE